MTREQHDRLVSIIDEAFGLQPVEPDTDALLTSLERLLDEQHITNANAILREEQAAKYWEKRARELGVEDY